MENIFKNKLNNYEETPPDFILKNIKNKIRRANSSFITRNKYYIAASIVAITVISVVLFNNNDKEEQKNIAKTNNVSIVEKEQIKDIKSSPLVKEKTIENKTKNETVSIETKIINTPKEKTQVAVINKNINAGADVIVCGNTFNMKPINVKNGFWRTDANIVINNKNNPYTEITSIAPGTFILIWQEKIADNYIKDTVKITFINQPKSDIEIKQTNEVCANNNAEIHFITNSKYNYRWNDGFTTNKNYRKNLSADTYNITVSNTYCSDVLNVNITNKDNINADFYHTELYSAVNIPFYFTNRTKLDSDENTHINYLWNFGDEVTSNEENPEHTYTKSGDFNIKLLAVTNNGCKDSLILKVTIDEKEVKMPNIFTPNGDGKHDVLILNPKPLTEYYAKVFDRSGIEIAHWTDVNKGWDGKLKSGDNASVGVYYYIVSGIDTDGKRFIYKSFVHLSR